MAFATVTKYDADAWHFVEPKALQHGDLVARVTENGAVAPRVVLKHDGKPPALLGYPKRMVQVEGDGALLTNYVGDDGNVLVIGHVTPAEAKPKASSNGKAKATPKPKASSSGDTTPVSPSSKMTKATAADALVAIADAIEAQGTALRAVAAALL